MKKFKFSSRVLAFVLAFVMIVSLFPLSALAVTQFDIVTEEKYVGTGIDNDTLNKDDAINWPIKVYDHLADGMLFEFAQNQSEYNLNTSSKGSVSGDMYGGQYVLGQPMPYAQYGHDYTTDKVYVSDKVWDGYATEDDRYVKTRKAAVDYSCPQYMRITASGSYLSSFSSNLNCNIANFINDHNGNLDKTKARYMVMVYRAGGIENYGDVPGFAINITSGGTTVSDGSWLRFPSNNGNLYDINGQTMTNTSTWKAFVCDFATLNPTNWSSISKMAGVFLRVVQDSTSDYFDIAQLGFFSDVDSAKTYAQQCLKFISEPGEYISGYGGLYWNPGNNTGFGMLHPSNSAALYSNTAAGGAYDTTVGGSASTGYYTHRIGYWISESSSAATSNSNRKKGKDADGRFNGTGDVQGENGIYYISATSYASDAGTATYDMSNLNFGGYNLLTEGIKGVWTAGLLQNTLGKDGTPQYKQETVEYIADMLSKTLVIPQYAKADPSVGYPNYNYVAGVKNRAQFGYTEVNGTKVDNDLAQGLRNCLGIEFTKGNWKGKTPTMGTYADTLAKADKLKGAFLSCSENIKTCMDAAYYLLHNTFVADSYNQLQDDFTYLTLSSAKLDSGEQAYVFDGGFSQGAEIEDVINNKITQAEYKAMTHSAVEYSGYNQPNGTGTISLGTVNEKDYFYYGTLDSSVTTKYPFLPVVEAEGVYAGQTDSYYFAEDGKRSFTLDNDTYYGRNYGYTMVSNGEFVYQENENLYFEFEGDDDVYLFINGQLVLDLGGGHSVASCRFNVNDYVEWARTVLANPASYTPAQVERAEALNLEDGEIANFDFYYMERHGYGANCRIVTNMHITDPALRVQKQAYQGGKELDYGGIVDGATPIAYKFTVTNGGNTKLYNFTFDDADIGVSLTPENGLYVKNDDNGNDNDDINGYIVTDARLGKLEAQDLIATVKGYKDVGTGGNYDYDYATDTYNKVEAGTGEYEYAVADVTFADNDALKRFLATLEADSTDNTTVDDEQTRRGSGLWVDATLEISGIYYTMTREQVEAGSFNNTVYVTSTTKANTSAPGCELLRSDDSHRVYITAIPAYYQWKDNELFITEERILEDAAAEAGNTNSLLHEYKSFFDAVAEKGKGTQAIISVFCDKNGTRYPDYKTAYEHVTDGKDAEGNWGFLANYDTTGIHEFYLLMYKNPAEFSDETITGVVDTMDPGQYAIVRVLVIVADVEDSTYVLDYGLKTENLDTNGELFKGDELLGSLSGTYAKLMGVSTAGGSYMKMSDGTLDYNRIDFNPMELDEHNDISVNGKDGKPDGFYTFNMNIPAEGKDITYNEFSGMYSLTDSGTTLVHAYVPYTWNNLYLYYWYDDGTNNKWPGELMTKTSAGNFNLSIPGNVPYIIISDGKNQSVDLTINPGEEVWIDFGDLDQTADGKYIPTIEYKSKNSILHTKVPDGWGDVYVYCKDAFNNAVVEWPGTQIDTVENGYYTIELPGDITNVIINNGGDKAEAPKQTVDQTITAGKESWLTIESEPTEDSKGQTPEYYHAVVTTTQEKVVMHATVPENWEKACLYYWHSNGSSTGFAWPGIEMVKGENTNVYSLEVPADIEHVIVNDGNYRQTENIDVTAGLETWINVNPLTSTATVEATVPDGWGDAYFFFFNGDNDKPVGGEWPGKKGAKTDSNNTYAIDVPSYATHVIITAENKSIQTEDLPLNANSVNKFEVAADGSVDVAATKVRVKVTDDWSGPVNIYYWNGSKNNGWPGTKIDTEDENGYYTYTIDDQVEYVIINNVDNGEGTQTVDLKVTPYATNTIELKEDMVDGKYEATVTVTDVKVEIVRPATKTTATVSYGQDAEAEGFTFTPVDFMDSEYSLWLALTVHEKEVTPTKLGQAINIGKEVQMVKKVTVLPANVVYYEDTFAGVKYTDMETTNVITHYTSGSGSLTQSVDQNQQYGNDNAYHGSENDEMTGGSLTDVYINDSKTFATFDFSGTGFEIIGHTHAVESGTLVATIFDENNKEVKRIIAITEFDNGANGGTESVVSIPVIRVNGLKYGKYTVKLSGVPVYNFSDWTDKTKAPPVDTSYLCIDGIRIFQPLDNSSDIPDSANLALNKTYDAIDAGQGYTANLTDGAYATAINFSNRSEWFGFNKELNATDGVGYVTVDLEKDFSLESFKMHLSADNIESGIGQPGSVAVAVSSDGINYDNVGNLSVTSSATAAYWAELNLSTAKTGRYVRFCVYNNADGRSWNFLNEVEVYGTEVVEAGKNDAYLDTENGADFEEVRNLIADRQAFVVKYDDTDGLSVSGGTNTWTENRNNVLPGDHNTVWTNNTVNSVNDYLLAGPNNEVYMIESTDAEKSALAFYVKETGEQNANMQIAVRALNYDSFTGTQNSGKLLAEIQYGAVDANGELVWKTLTTTVTSTEQYFTVPYTECPYDEANNRYQVVLRVADTTPTGMAAYTSLKYKGLELLKLNDTEVPDVIYGEEIGNTILDSNGNTLDTSKFVGFIELVDQMNAPVAAVTDNTGTTTEPVITGESTSSMSALYDSFEANNTYDFAITDDSKIYVVTTSEDNTPAQEVLDTAQLVQRQFKADGYDMDTVWGLEKYAEKGDILVYVDSEYTYGDEGYKLEVTDRAKLYANTSDGMLYGLNTLQKHFRAAGKNAIKGFTIVDAPDTKERTVHLDCARKYLSKDFICNYLAEMSWMGYNSLELHMAEDGGFRMDFWGDKALKEVTGMTGNNFSWVCGSNPAPWVLVSDPDKGKYLTTEEIIEICETAKEYHIEIIPSFDTPAHVGYMTELYYNKVKADPDSSIRNFTYNGISYKLPEQINYKEYTGATDSRYDFSVLDLSNTAVKNFAYALYTDIAAFFAHYAGSTKFNIGADEVSLDSSSRWNYETDFVNYVNDVNKLLKAQGYTTRMYNDFLYNTKYTSVATGIDTDIEVVYWTAPVDSSSTLRPASFFVNQGRTIYSGVNYWTYYVLRLADASSVNAANKGRDARDPNNTWWSFYRNGEDAIYNEWKPSLLSVYDSNLSDNYNYSGNQLAGGYFMVWCDYGGLNTEVEMWNGVYDRTGISGTSNNFYSLRERMWSNAIKQWNTDINGTLSFASYEPLRDKQGDFPGYVATDSSQARMEAGVLPEKESVEAAYRTYHTVTFVNYDGTVIDTQEVKEGFSATAPAVTPTRPADVWYTYSFSNWDTDFSNITDNITVTAQYTPTATVAGTTGYLELKSSGGSDIEMSVDGVSRYVGTEFVNSSMDFGQYVTVKAITKNGNKFIGWVNAKTGSIVSNNSTYSFYTSGNDVFVAMYAVDVQDESLVTFRNDKTNQIIHIQYYGADDTIDYPAVANYPGYEFAGWDLSATEIAEKIAAGENFTVTTKWNVKNVFFKVIVNSGYVVSSGGGGVDGQFTAYKATVVKAADVGSRYSFACWKDEQGRIVSYDAEYKFYPHKNTELTACYVLNNETVDYNVISTVDIDATTLGDANTVFFSWDSSHTDYDILNRGVLLVKEEHYYEPTFGVGTIDNNVLQFVPSIKNSNIGSYSITIPNVKSGDTWIAKSFVQYRDEYGILRIVYSDVCEVTKT